MAEFRSAVAGNFAAASTSGTVTLPTGWQHGDLVVIHIGWNASISARVDPTGWTVIGSSPTSNAAWYRVMRVGDQNPSWSWTTGTNAGWTAQAYVGPMSRVALEASAFASAASATIDPGAITTLSANALVIWDAVQIGAGAATLTTPPTDYGLQVFNGTSEAKWGMSKIQATAGSTGSNAATSSAATANRVMVSSWAVTRFAFQEVDPDDLSTVLFDYADSTGLQNPGTVKTWFGLGGAFNLAAPQVSIDTTDRVGEAGTDTTFTYDDVVQSTFRIRAQAGSYGDLRTGIGELQQLLSADGVIRWCPDDTSTYYVYRKPSNIPALFQGNDLELYERLRLFDSPQGVDVVLNRERLIRGPRLAASVNRLRNGTMMVAAASGSGRPAQYSWDSTANITSELTSAANQAFQFTIATTGTRNLQQITDVAAAAPGDIWTFSYSIKATGGSLAKSQAVVEFLDSGSGLLATWTGTLTTLVNGADFVRLAVTTQAAPASTSIVRASVRMANGDATSYVVYVRRAQAERSGGATTFRVGNLETVTGTGNTTGYAAQMYAHNPGDGNALTRVYLTASGSTNTLAYLLARRAEGPDVNIAEPFRTQANVAAQTLYAGTTGDTSSQVDGASVSGSAARTTFSNVPNLVRRWRWVTTPTDAEVLHGRWSVYLSVKGDTGKTFRICMHWQSANRDPVTETGDVITYDTTDATTSSYTPLYLGDVTFDANAGATALAIEGWAACDSGTVGNLWSDVVYLVPADEQQTLVQVPGFRRGQQSVETWLGSELTNQPAGCKGSSSPAGSTKAVLDDQYEGVGTPPGTLTSGGVVWTAGRHKVSATVSLKEPSGTAATTIGRLRIRKAPGPGVSLAGWSGATGYVVGNFVKPTAGNLNGRTFVVTSIAGTGSGGSEPTWPSTDGGTVTQNPGVNQVVWTETTVASRALTTKSQYNITKITKSVEATADGTTAYEGVVVHSAATATNQSITVLSMRHFTQRIVDSGYTIQMFSDLEVLQTANGTVAVDEMVKQGPYITLGSGLNLVWADLWTQGPLAYDDMDTRGALGLHEISKTTTVGIDVIPRYWG